MDTDTYSGPRPPDYRLVVDRIKNTSTLDINNLADISGEVFDIAGPTLADRLIDAACYVLMGTACNENLDLYRKCEKYVIDRASDCFAKEYLSKADPAEYAQCITEFPSENTPGYTITVTETNSQKSEDLSRPAHVSGEYMASLTMNIAPNTVTTTTSKEGEVDCPNIEKTCTNMIGFDIDDDVEILGGK